MICNNFYFKDVEFKDHDFSMTVQNLSYFFILTVGNIDYRDYITGADKKSTMHILDNSVLDDKGVL